MYRLPLQLVEKKALLTDVASSTGACVFICQDKHACPGAEVPMSPREGGRAASAGRAVEQTRVISVHPGSCLSLMPLVNSPVRCQLFPVIINQLFPTANLSDKGG